MGSVLGHLRNLRVDWVMDPAAEEVSRCWRSAPFLFLKTLFVVWLYHPEFLVHCIWCRVRYWSVSSCPRSSRRSPTRSMGCTYGVTQPVQAELPAFNRRWQCQEECLIHKSIATWVFTSTITTSRGSPPYRTPPAAATVSALPASRADTHLTARIGAPSRFCCLARTSLTNLVCE